jgi:hypothetical protein
MRVVRLDAKANKRKIADTFLLASLISRAFSCSQFGWKIRSWKRQEESRSVKSGEGERGAMTQL